MAQPVAAGAFTAPGRGGTVTRFENVPAFCRVQASLKPTSDSDIRMELWLPASADGSGEAGRTAWNGKFRGTGNGGLGGGTGANPNQLAAGVRAGYATAGHNTGHEGDSSYALDHPEKIKDFGYRSTHERPDVQGADRSTPRGACRLGGGRRGDRALSSAQLIPRTTT